MFVPARVLLKKFKVGDAHVLKRVFTQADVDSFANLIGDRNPIHLSVEAAKKAGFPNTICHGALVGSLFSTIMGMHLPGPQSVYMQQSYQFTSPVFVGDGVTATVRIKEFHKDKKLLWLDTIVTKEPTEVGKDPIVCITGTALGMNKTLELEGDSSWTFVRSKQ